jgi:hypothetical protein
MAWAVEIDWDDDAQFDDEIDDIWEYVISADWRLGMGKAWQLIQDEPNLTLYLRNDDGRWNPENPASPYAGYMFPNRKIRVRKDGSTVWIGWVELFSPEWVSGGTQTGKTIAVIKAVGFKKRFQDVQIALPLYESTRTDEIIADLLGMVVLPPATPGGWLLGVDGYSELGVSTYLSSPSDYSELDTGLTLDYYGDVKTGEVNKTVWGVIDEVVNAERGKFFQNELGKAVFWNRDRLLDDIVNDETIDDSGVLGTKPNDLDYKYGENLSNEVRVTAFPRTLGGNITLWELEYSIALTPNEIITLEAKFTDTDGKPAGAYDNVTTSGVTFTGSGSVSLEVQADRATVTITNNDSSANTLTAMSITGDVLTSTNRVEVVRQDIASILAYGKRGGQNLNLVALSDYQDAVDIAEWELNLRANPRGEVSSINMINPSSIWEIGTRLRVKLSNGHDKPYFIIGTRQKVQGGLHTLDYILEPAVARIAAYAASNQDSWVGLDL